MVYESGFTTRRTYSSRPVVSSYTVSRYTPTTIDWEKCPFVPRPSLISDPVTAFGRNGYEHKKQQSSILDPINRAAIKPNYTKLEEPIQPYVSARDKNRSRILNMTPRYDLVSAAPGTHRSRGSSDYSYSYKSSVEKSNYDSSNPYSRPERYESKYETTSRSGPGGYNYTTERSSTLGGGPGGYSYSSTTSGVLPGGTRYRHFSYHV